MGNYNIVTGDTSNWLDTDPLFVVGNGNYYSRSNALTVLKNGNVGIGILEPTNRLEVNGVITAIGGTSTNWNSAYNWGNHATAGYLNSSSSINALSDVNTANAEVNQLLGWNGTNWVPVNPSSGFEADPWFVASPAYNITNGNIYNWNTAFGWGNHASAGYVTSTNLSNNSLTKWNGNNLSNSLIFDNGTSIGIGTTAPANEAKLEISNGTVLFSGNNGNIPISGTGTRFMWIPSKKALRAGGAYQTSWDSVNIGDFSVALGEGTIASGDRTTAFGAYSEAIGENSIAMGKNCWSYGDYATAIGYQAQASGSASISMGANSHSSGDGSVSFGSNAWAFGEHSTALGFDSHAYGIRSVAIGSAQANGVYSTSIGYLTHSKAYRSLVLGSCNVIQGDSAEWVSTDPIFVIGNGEDLENRSNAMTVLKNGNVGIGVLQPTNKLEVDGTIVATGGNSNNWNTAFGWGNHSSAGYISGGSLSNNYIPKSNGTALVNSSIFDNGNIGIGTSSPTAKLQITDGSFLAFGGVGATPVSGAGTRMMWVPEKYAFRAGYVSDNHWDAFNIGNGSVAFGVNTIASVIIH